MTEDSGMTWQELMETAELLLSAAGVTDAKTDLFYLLQSVTGFSGADYLLKKTEAVPSGNAERFLQLVKRRAGHEPCQYILGTTEFMGLEFEVTPDVLIPRQDTEILAEEAIRLLKESGTDTKQVLDLCTGSGAIAVAVSCFCPWAEVTAADISKEALKIAEKNGKRHNADIRFVESDMFGALSGRTFDMILSNPPYVTEKEYGELMEEVRGFEPARALLAGEDGLDYYRIIAAQAGAFLKEGGRLLLEIGSSQAEEVSGLLAENGYQEIRVLKDLAGLDRVVAAVSNSPDR